MLVNISLRKTINKVVNHVYAWHFHISSHIVLSIPGKERGRNIFKYINTSECYYLNYYHSNLPKAVTG